MTRPLLATLPLLALACADTSFSAEAARAADVGAHLPRGFLLGTATASHQVEGGTDNDWTAWEQGAFPDGTPHIKGDVKQSGLATDSWNRFDTDLALMQRLGANAYRFSLEWSRIEPARGVFDEAALGRYRDWARALRAAGLTPLVTVYHFTLPRWVADQGGWESAQTLDDFEAYAARVGEALGADVDFWCTVNEPNVVAVQGYLDGIWPPGKKDDVKAMSAALANLIEAHARATRSLRRTDTRDADGDGHATRVGFAHHVRLFTPATGSTWDTAVSGLTDDFFNDGVLDAIRSGTIRLEVPGQVSLTRSVPDLKGSLDWLGVNYYTRNYVRLNLADASLSTQATPDGRELNDLGWEVYPEGLYLLLKRYAALGLPLYVTENGMADEDGQQRPDFLLRHLFALERAVAEGADVRGYFHWSLLDNFEWAEGYTARFGLYRVDFTSAERTRADTPAVERFREVARRAGLQPKN